MDSPIQVGNSLTPVLITVLRSLIVAVAGTTTYVSTDDATKIASAVVTLGGILWGMYRAYKNNEDKKTMEPYVPDVVATKK